jgi:hypothetical protein
MEAAASQLSTLSFRQTPVLKEPPAPPKIAERSFITFEESASKPGAGSHVANPVEVLESIFRLFLKQGEGDKMTSAPMFASPQTQDKGLLDLLPVLINVLTKSYQPGMQGSQGMPSQDKGLIDLLPVLLGALTKSHQPQANMGMAGSMIH